MSPARRAADMCVAVGKRADGQGIDLGSAVPVIVIFGQGQVMIRLHVGHHIGARARNDPFFKIGCLHIDDTAVGDRPGSSSAPDWARW